MATPKAPKPDRSEQDASENPKVSDAIEDAEVIPPTPELAPQPDAAAEPVLLIDPEPLREDRATAPVAPPSESARPSSGALPLVFGGVIAAVIGFGVAQVVPQGWPRPVQTAVPATLTDTVAAQSAEIARLSDALAALPSSPPPADLSQVEAQMAALADRVAAAEAAVASIPAPPPAPADSAPLIADIEARLARLEGLPPGTVIDPGDGMDPAALAALARDFAALKSEIAAQTGSAEAAVAQVSAAAKAAQEALAAAQADADRLATEQKAAVQSTTRRAGLDRIAAALETGAPFATALPMLQEAGVAAPEDLTAVAETGVPSLASLQAQFPDLARAALDDSLRATMGDGAMSRLGAFLRSQTGARSLTPREGSDPDAILSRAEAALREGRLDAALAEVAALPPEGQAALATWTEAASRRQAALAALTALAGG